MKALNKISIEQAIKLNERGYTFLIEDGEVICMRKRGMMGRSKVELDFKELNILKHALERYVSRANGTEKDKQEEGELLIKLNLVLDRLY